ncbi:MAG: type I restriction enzyme, R subunit [bacterium P201]|nr:MAG: type I restriction enzyme, R subunit [bacterium P201]
MTQSEEILEQGLIKTLTEMNYEYVSIKEEENLLANFKVQLEKHNQKDTALSRRWYSL